MKLVKYVSHDLNEFYGATLASFEQTLVAIIDKQLCDKTFRYWKFYGTVERTVAAPCHLAMISILVAFAAKAKHESRA